MGVPGLSELLILLILLIIAGIVILFVAASRRRNSRDVATEQGSGDARQVLDERYARGELGRDMES